MRRPDEHGRRPSILNEEAPTGSSVLHWTAPPGLEDISAQEAIELQGAGWNTERLEPEALGLPGHVALRTQREPGEIVRELLGMRSAYHLIRHRGFLRIGEDAEAEDLAAGLGDFDIPELAEGTRSFRVSCNRDGTHRFKSPDVERAVGARIVDRWNAPVDLEQFQVHVRIDIVHEIVLLGVQLTQRALDRRYPWVYRPRVTLRTTVAYGMITLAGRARTAYGGISHLLDPFCGSGTIPVETAVLRPDIQISACDKREEAVEGTRANLEALGLTHRIGVSQADARDLDEHFDRESVDAIVSNPPFGVRLHKEADFRRLYERFLRTAHVILAPEGVIVMLVGKKRGLFNKLLRELALYDLLEVRIIEIGGVYPGIFVLRKRGES